MVRHVEGPPDDHDPRFKWCVGCGTTIFDQPVTDDPSLIQGQLDPNTQGLCDPCHGEYESMAEKIAEFADRN